MTGGPAPDDHAALAELCGAYALGALDGEELRRFHAHLSGCWACRQSVMEFDEVYAEGTRALAPVQPSAAVKARVLARASRTGPALPAPGATDGGRGAAGRAVALLVLVAVALAAAAVGRWSAEGALDDLRQRLGHGEAQAEALRAEVRGLRAEVERLRRAPPDAPR